MEEYLVEVMAYALAAAEEELAPPWVGCDDGELG